jgi:hypothetical protein
MENKKLKHEINRLFDQQTMFYTPVDKDVDVRGGRTRQDSSYDTYQDFPNIDDPVPYITHKTLESEKIEEQNPAKADTAVPKVGGVDVMGGGDLTGDPNIPGTDPNAMPPGTDPNSMAGGLGAMPGMDTMGQQTLTSSEIGRVYELKKIYSRLTSIESYLSSSTDEALLHLRTIVSRAIDLFDLVIINFTQYKEQIDEIIVMFYKFVDITYALLRDYYAHEAKEESKNE